MSTQTHNLPPKLSVHPDGYLVTEAGKPFFYLADTAWMAFANLSLADWARILPIEDCRVSMRSRSASCR